MVKVKEKKVKIKGETYIVINNNNTNNNTNNNNNSGSSNKPRRRKKRNNQTAQQNTGQVNYAPTPPVLNRTSMGYVPSPPSMPFNRPPSYMDDNISSSRGTNAIDNRFLQSQQYQDGEATRFSQIGNTAINRQPIETFEEPIGLPVGRTLGSIGFLSQGNNEPGDTSTNNNPELETAQSELQAGLTQIKEKLGTTLRSITK